MDKLAKRVGVAALVVIASVAATAAFGLYRMARSLEPSENPGASTPKLAAVLKLPETPEPAPVPAAAPAEPAKPADAPAIVEAAKKDLASAFGSALGVDPSKHAARLAAEGHAPSTSATPEADSLNLGAVPARTGKLGDREAKPASIHQTGGVEQQRKAEKSQEHLSFETDLGTAR